MQSQRILTNFFPHKNITYKNKVYVQEVYFYIDDVIVTDKEFLDHNLKYPICHSKFLRISDIEIHRRHEKKNTPPFIHLSASDTDYLSSLRSFQTVTTQQWIILWLYLSLTI